MHTSVIFFVGWVDYLKHCKLSTFLQKERRVLTRKINQNVKLPHSHVFCGRLNVLYE